MPDAYGQSLEALPSQPAASRSESRVLGAGSESEYPVTIAVSDVHGAETRVHIPAHGGSEIRRSPNHSYRMSPRLLETHKLLSSTNLYGLLIKRSYLHKHVTRCESMVIAMICESHLLASLAREYNSCVMVKESASSVSLVLTSPQGHSAFSRNCLYGFY
ncbi:hypothetical protein Tco_0273099 [Tanacetum coccineum]